MVVEGCRPVKKPGGLLGNGAGDDRCFRRELAHRFAIVISAPNHTGDDHAQ
nr:MAG TPA: hypothetical protein [Caudoviricetes sp.]